MSESQLFYRDKQAWENAIETYKGNDPLELWFNYICWYDYNVHLDVDNKFQQSLEKCLSIFEHNETYKQDIRMVKLWVKYIDLQANPLNLYQILYQRGIGTQCSCFYIGWAHYYDSANAFKQAESVFNLGFQAKAEPYIELQEAHTKFRLSVSQRMLYNDSSSKKRSFNNLIEQRQQITALTSNAAMKKNKIDNQVEFDNCTSSPYPSSQVQYMGNKERNYCMDQTATSTPASAAVAVTAAATTTTTIRQNNDLNKSNNSYMMISSQNHIEMKVSDNFEKHMYALENVKLGPNFSHYAKNNFETWKPLLFVEEPFETTKTCIYQKHLVYPGDGTEYSPEEIKARKWNQKMQLLRQSSNYMYEQHQQQQQQQQQQQRRYFENLHNIEYVQQQKSKVQNFNTTRSSFPEKEIQNQNTSKIQYARSQLCKSRENLQKSNYLGMNKNIQQQYEQSDNIWHDNHSQNINDGIYMTENNEKTYYPSNELQYATEKSQSTSYYVQQTSNSYMNNNKMNHNYTNSDSESYSRNFDNKFQYTISSREQNHQYTISSRDQNHHNTVMDNTHSQYNTNETTQHFDNYTSDDFSYTEENRIQQQQHQQQQQQQHQQQQHQQQQQQQQQQQDKNHDDDVRSIEDTTDYHYLYTNDNSNHHHHHHNHYYKTELNEHYHDKSSQTTTTIVQHNDPHHNDHHHNHHQHHQNNHHDHFEDNNAVQQNEIREQHSLNGNVESHIEASTIRFSTDADGKTKNKRITIKFRREAPSKYSINATDTKTYTTTSTEIDRVKRYMSDDESCDDKDYKNGSVEQHNNFPIKNTTKQKRVKRIKIVNRYDKESKRKSTIELKSDRTSDDSNSFNDSNTTQDNCYDDSVSENAEFNISSSNESNSNFTISSSKLSPYPSKTSSSTATVTVQNFRDLKRLTLNSSSLQNDDSSLCSYEQTTQESYYENDNNGLCNNNEKELVQKRLTKALITIETHLVKSNLDPFKNELCNAFLAKLNFPSENDTNAVYRLIDTPIPKLNNVKTTILADTTYNIEREVGKGSYGSVYKAVNTDTGGTVALKYQKPPNKWEIYICCEVRKRIKNYNILPGFMNISSAIIAPNASIIVTEFSVYGSLLDVNNKVRQATKKVMHESLAMHFGSQILDIVNHLHSCKIIHADIKPDNFLLMKIPSSDSLTPSLRLIDFGCAIDMKLFPDNTQFKKIIQTDGFTCIEMQEGRPWSYQTDLFCVAGTIHVMLFGEYMQILKKFDQWDIKQKLPRYLKKHVWTEFFSKMLNIKNLENLPNLIELKSMFDNELRKMDSELQMQIRTLSNILHRR